MMFPTNEVALNGSDDPAQSLVQNGDVSASTAQKNQLTDIAQALLTSVSAKQVLGRTPRDINSDWRMMAFYAGTAFVQVVGAAFIYWCVAQTLELWDFLAWSKSVWVVATPAYNLSLQIFYSVLSLAIFTKLAYQLYDMGANFSKDSPQSGFEAFLNAVTQSVTTGLFAYLTWESVFGFAAMSEDAAEQCSVIDASQDSELFFGSMTVTAFSFLMVPGVMKFVVTLLHYSIDRMMKNIYQTGILKLLPILDIFMLKHNRRQFKEMQVKDNIEAKMMSLKAFLNANTFPDAMPKDSAEDYERYQALTHHTRAQELGTIENAVAQWQRGEQLSDADIVALHIAMENIKNADSYHGKGNAVALPWHWALFGLMNFSSVIVSSSVIWANLAGSDADAVDVMLSILIGAATVSIAAAQFNVSLYTDATATAFSYEASIFNEAVDRRRRMLRNVFVPGAAISSASIVALDVKNYGSNPFLELVIIWSTIVNNGSGIGVQLFAAIKWFQCQLAMHAKNPSFSMQAAQILLWPFAKILDAIEWSFTGIGVYPSLVRDKSVERDVAQLALMQSLSELLEQGLANSRPDNAYEFLQSITKVSQGIAAVNKSTHDELDVLSADERQVLAMPTPVQAIANCTSWLMQAAWFSLAKSELGLGFSFKDDALMYGAAALISVTLQVVANFFEKNATSRALPALLEASLFPAIIGFLASVVAEYGGHFLKHKDLSVGPEDEFDGTFTLLECFLISLVVMHCAQFAPPMTPVTNYVGHFFEAKKAKGDYEQLEGHSYHGDKTVNDSDDDDIYLNFSANRSATFAPGNAPVFM